MKCLLYHAKSGLANRLRAFAGYRALSRFRNLPFYVYWEANGACNAAFSDLFELDGLEDVHFIPEDVAHTLRESRGTEFHDAGIWFADIWEKHGQEEASRRDFYRAAYETLKGLRPNAAIRARIDDFLGRVDLSRHTGIHIRMTDNVHAYDWWSKNDPSFDRSKVSSLEGFQAILSDLQKQREPVFLCTDNTEIASRILHSHDNVCMYDKRYDDRGFRHHFDAGPSDVGLLSRGRALLRRVLRSDEPVSWRTTDIEDALIDLLLLSRCRRIIGTYYSSFAEVSAILGNIPLSVLHGDRCVEHARIRDIQRVLREPNDNGTGTTS